MSAPKLTAEEQAAHRAKQPPLMDFMADATAREMGRVSLDRELAAARMGADICAWIKEAAEK